MKTSLSVDIRRFKMHSLVGKQCSHLTICTTSQRMTRVIRSHLNRLLKILQCIRHTIQVPINTSQQKISLHQFAPTLTLGKDIEEIGRFPEIRHPVRVILIRIDKDKATGRIQNVPNFQIAGGRGHFTIVIIPEFTIAVFVKVINCPPFQQSRLRLS